MAKRLGIGSERRRQPANAGGRPLQHRGPRKTRRHQPTVTRRHPPLRPGERREGNRLGISDKPVTTRRAR